MENTLFYFMIDLIGPVILIGICDVHVPFYFKNRIDVIAEIIYIYITISKYDMLKCFKIETFCFN
jgi:hypothetical protein